MATKLFFRETFSDTHRGTNTAKLNGSTSGWVTRLLSLNVGTGLVTITTNTVAGPTAGIESEIGGFPVEFLTLPLDTDITISGVITANIWASESDMNANAAINFVVDKVASIDGTITQIVKSARVTEMALTTSAVNNFTATPGAGVTVNKGDRIRVRIFADDAGTMGAFTFNTSYNRPTVNVSGDTFITFTENFSFNDPAPSTSSLTQNGGVILGNDTNNARLAQSFQLPGAGAVKQITMGATAVIGAGTEVLWSIEADSAGLPSGTALESGTFGVIDTVGAKNVYPAGTVTLTANTTYWLVLDGAPVDSANYLQLYRDSTQPYTLGTCKRYNSFTSVWSDLTILSDLYFSITAAAGSRLYLTDTASTVNPGAAVEKEAWTARGGASVDSITNTATGWTAPIQVRNTAAGTVIEWYSRELTGFTLAGTCRFNIRAKESDLLANASLGAEVAVCAFDGSAPSVVGIALIAGNADNGELATTDTAYTADVGVDDTVITAGQRLRFRIYLDDISSVPLVTGYTTTVTYNGPTAVVAGDTYVTLPQTVSEFVAAAPIPNIYFALNRT